MSNIADKVVFDCNVFLEYFLNPVGTGGRCVQLALEGDVQLFLSTFVLQEISQLPDKQVGREHGITQETIEQFLSLILAKAFWVLVSTNISFIPSTLMILPMSIWR